jgi:hypothetical protein
MLVFTLCFGSKFHRTFSKHLADKFVAVATDVEAPRLNAVIDSARRSGVSHLLVIDFSRSRRRVTIFRKFRVRGSAVDSGNRQLSSIRVSASSSMTRFHPRDPRLSRSLRLFVTSTVHRVLIVFGDVFGDDACRSVLAVVTCR